MYNIVARSRSRFSVDKQQCILCVCVVVELYVSVKYVTIMRLHSAFVVSLCYRHNANYT